MCDVCGVVCGWYVCVGVVVWVGVCGGAWACACVCNLGLPVYFAQRLTCVRVIQNL